MTSTEWTEDAVLEAFLLESIHADALERYLQRYPDYAEALIDLAHEIAFVETRGDAPATSDEDAWIAGAWGQLNAALASKALTANDWSPTIIQQMQSAFTALPTVVFTCLRDRKVLASTVPQTIMGRLAEILQREVDVLKAFLEGPSVLARSAAYKSKTPPKAADKISFEDLLKDAGVSDADRRRLLDGSE